MVAIWPLAPDAGAVEQGGGAIALTQNVGAGAVAGCAIAATGRAMRTAARIAHRMWASLSARTSCVHDRERAGSAPVTDEALEDRRVVKTRTAINRR